MLRDKDLFWVQRPPSACEVILQREVEGRVSGVNFLQSLVGLE